MKRIILLVLVVIICLSLIACGAKSEEAEVQDKKEITQTLEPPEIIVVPEPEETQTVIEEQITSGEEEITGVVDEVSGE